MSITREKADAIMEKIAYSRVLEFEPETDKHICLYRNVYIDSFSIIVEIRLFDAAFKFCYTNALKITSRLETGWFSPVTDKKHFLKFFNIFMGEAIWMSQYKEREE